jgi:broad specificity phosphatase PhoE
VNDKKRVLLIRHGQTDWNMQGKWQGMMDIPLNAAGIDQAHALAQRLQDQPIDAIYSSDLLRARVTAEIVADALHLPVYSDARLRELNLGVFQGMTHPEISAKFPKELEASRIDYMGFTYPQGESRMDMQNRAYAALMDILQGDKAQQIAIFSHGGTIRSLLLRLFPEQKELVSSTSLQNTSVTHFVSDGEAHSLLDLAMTDHLDVHQNVKSVRDDV